MKSLRAIYNGILGDIDNNIDNMNKEIDDINNSYFERILTILSDCGKLNTKQKYKLRVFLDSNVSQCKYVHFHIPKMIKDKLIVLSDRKLTNKDFEGIPSISKEYEFGIGISYQILLRNAPEITKFVKGEIDTKDGELQSLNGNTTICKFNDMKICLFKGNYNDNTLYVWFNNCRLVIDFITSNIVSRNKYIRKLF